MAVSKNLGVFGGTHGVGKHFVIQALKAGYSVTALARTPSKLDDIPVELKTQLTIVQGDVLDKAAVDQVVKGQDAIINSLGSGSVLKGPGVDICSTGSKVIIASMNEFGVKRTVIVTSFGVGDSYNDASFLVKPIFSLMLGKVIADKNIQEKLYFDSDLDWSIVRPGGLTDAPAKGNYRHGPHISSSRISREDVAAFLLKELTSSEYLKKTVTVSD